MKKDVAAARYGSLIEIDRPAFEVEVTRAP